MEGPLRLARPTLEGEEPERERGGVCTDIMADWKYTTVRERFGQPPGFYASAPATTHSHTSEQGRGRQPLISASPPV